ncbi:hypothetical protein HA402_010474 [Bradysia odoriphaga]|nr:hypothetical protein HA402_010474 [Bradysia odoriphaga]
MQLHLVLWFLITLVVVDALTTYEEAKRLRENLVNAMLKPLPKDGKIRLIGGENEYEGNVEIFHDRKWGSICDDEWDRNDGIVACRQLGYSGLVKVTHNSYFGTASQKFWMDNMLCDGTETKLKHCRFDDWGRHDCNTSEAAGIVCVNPLSAQNNTKQIRPRKKVLLVRNTNAEVRLSGSSSSHEGQVEVRFNGSLWGSICADGWSLLEANVVCKSLGLGYASGAVQTEYFGGAKFSKLLLSGSECRGNENSFFDCVFDEPGDIKCPGPKNHVAAVVCSEKMSDLIFDHRELEQTAHLEDRSLYYLQCAMEENCLSSQAYVVRKENPNWHYETRRLLKFTAKVLNAGTDDFRSYIPKHLWEWHMCHMHYHSMEVFAVFNILNEKNETVAEGHKASFCLEDNQCLPDVKPKYACANFGDQGISVNCSDIYRFNIDCQWIDITELEVGSYTIKISVNSEFKVPEMNFENNAAVCSLLYTETYARVFNCHLERP